MIHKVITTPKGVFDLWLFPELAITPANATRKAMGIAPKASRGRSKPRWAGAGKMWGAQLNPPRRWWQLWKPRWVALDELQCFEVAQDFKRGE